jgi:DNA-directed RNA polymerase subunit beta'
MLDTERSFDYVKINLASPELIRSWSERIFPDGRIVGEVTKPLTINYKTLKPEMDGLFCERIFGPANNWECHCGKYKQIRREGIICENCKVEVMEAIGRRHRIGLIELATPVTHIWYVKGRPSKIAAILGMTVKEVEEIIYFSTYADLIPDVDATMALIESEEFDEAAWEEFNYAYEQEFNDENSIGAAAVGRMLDEINLQKESARLRAIIPTSNQSERKKIIKRLRIIDQFIATGCDPSWMVLDVIPVLPPDLRPIVQLGNRMATSDLNDLYRRVISRNNRLIELKRRLSPALLLRNEKRMLQEAVDSLISNGKRGRAILGVNNRPLKSLSDIINGKKGRFRQNLLGKRVDYSGRSVIIVGPELRLNQCGLPVEMAVELFRPFLIHRLVADGIAISVLAAKRIIQNDEALAWNVLERVVEGHPILLNRAPTLHRLGIQSFEPTLIKGRAIKLHPLVCPAFNADFDGDQMAVHIPLCLEAQIEARMLMLAPRNFLSPATGEPALMPSQDMVLGSFYLTINNPSQQEVDNYHFSNFNDVILAYQQSELSVHTFVWVRCNESILENSFEGPQIHFNNFIYTISPYKKTKRSNTGEIITTYIRTTPGRILLNELFK